MALFLLYPFIGILGSLKGINQIKVHEHESIDSTLPRMSNTLVHKGEDADQPEELCAKINNF